MQPGWYSHVQNPGAVAYFDGTEWGTVRDGYALAPEIQKTITPLQPGHRGPQAPFETLTVNGPPCTEARILVVLGNRCWSFRGRLGGAPRHDNRRG